MRLVVDCCIRGADSATRRYYSAYLERAEERETQVLELCGLEIAPLNRELLRQRDELCVRRQFEHGMFDLARQFQAADEILIAAPYWDLSFPSLLRVYLERIMVCGLTFGYEADGRCAGYCRADRMLYFSACGGYCRPRHLGFEYLRSLCGMLGIPECVPFFLEGMDIDPSRREEILARAIAALPRVRGETGE